MIGLLIPITKLYFQRLKLVIQPHSADFLTMRFAKQSSTHHQLTHCPPPTLPTPNDLHIISESCGISTVVLQSLDEGNRLRIMTVSQLTLLGTIPQRDHIKQRCSHAMATVVDSFQKAVLDDRLRFYRIEVSEWLAGKFLKGVY